MSTYREEGTLVVRIDLSAEFGASYEGDDDGYAWLTAWRQKVQPRVVRAVFEALRSEPGYDAIPVSRGRSPDENVDIEVHFTRGKEPKT